MNKKLRVAIVTEFGTQSDFAVRLRVHESMISQVIQGRRKLPEKLQIKWAKELKYSREDLFNNGGVNNGR